MSDDEAPSGAATMNFASDARHTSIRIESAHIIGTKVVDETIHFIISVHTEGKEWCTIKRYSNFESFHELLLTIVSPTDLPVGCVLPGKRMKLWHNHLDRDFIHERTLLVDHYLFRCIQLSVINATVNDLFVGFLSTDSIVIEAPTYTPTSQRLMEYPFNDDVEITYIAINAIRVVNDHVLYQVDCSNSFKDDDDDASNNGASWTLLKRFQQFVDLDTVLRTSLSHRPDVIAQFFPLQRHIKLLYDHLDPHFIEHRRVLLQNYLQVLMLLEPVLYNEHFLSFLGLE